MFILRTFFYPVSMKTKDDLRTVMRKRREEMSKDEVKERSSLIFSNLITLPAFFSADVVHTYVSSKKNEVDTHNLIRWMLKEKKRVIVPVADRTTKLMRHSEIFTLSELAMNGFGTLEPKLERPAKISDIDIVIVPALAVDLHGGRIGFGAGYYDRFLHDLKPPAIALAYDVQVLDQLPQEPFDEKLSWIVTETRIVRCQ